MYTYILIWNFGHSSVLMVITLNNLDVLEIFYGCKNFHFGFNDHRMNHNLEI